MSYNWVYVIVEVCMTKEVRCVAVSTVTRVIKPRRFGQPAEIIQENHGTIIVCPDDPGERISTSPVTMTIIEP